MSTPPRSAKAVMTCQYVGSQVHDFSVLAASDVGHCHTPLMGTVTSSQIVWIGTVLAVALISVGVLIWLVMVVANNTETGNRYADSTEAKPWEKIWETISASLKTIEAGLSEKLKRVFAFGTLLVMLGLFIMIAWSMPILVADKAAGGEDPTPTPTPAASASPSPSCSPGQAPPC